MVGCWATSTETRCKFPGAPAHSTVSFSNDTLTTGAIATYTCERGFELLGPARRVCESTGEWLPEGIPFCGKFQIFFFLNLKIYIKYKYVSRGAYNCIPL